MERPSVLPVRLPVIVGLLVLLSAVAIGASLQPAGAAGTVVLGVYSCCGVRDCSVLSSTNACPSGQTQCDGVKIGGIQSSCCVNACNDPHPTDPVPAEPR